MTLHALLDIQDALSRAESFMAGFEDDEMQDGVAEDLECIRIAIGLIASAIRFTKLREA